MTDLKEEIKMWTEIILELQKKEKELLTQLTAVRNGIKRAKREVRKRYHWQDEYKTKPEDDWREYYPYDGYGDSMYVKYKLPCHLSPEEKKEFISEEWCHWYNPYDDGRDCTGVWFTTHINLVDCGDETWVIHRKDCDV